MADKQVDIPASPKDKIFTRRVLFSYVVAGAGVALIIVSFSFQWSEPTRAIFLALGSTLLSTALLSVFFEHGSRRLLKQELQILVRGEMNSCLSELRARLGAFSQARIIESGIVDYKTLEARHAEVGLLLASARKRIRVCKTWIPERDMVKLGLREALKAGDAVEVQILCLDPDSPVAKRRSLDYGEEANYGSKLIRDDLKGLCDFCKGEGLLDRVKIRTYQNLPSVSLYAADDTALLGWYWHGGLAFDGLKGEDSHLYKRVHRNFDELWLGAREYVCPGN